MAYCAATAGSGCRAVITAPVARWPLPLPACIAGGAGIEDAVRDAQDYTWQTLANGFRPGMGQFIPDRFFWARGDEDEAAENADKPDAK